MRRFARESARRISAGSDNGRYDNLERSPCESQCDIDLRKGPVSPGPTRTSWGETMKGDGMVKKKRKPSSEAVGQRKVTMSPALRGPYSPDLNPIELCFAKLKALVRTARCRSTETLWPFLGECLAHFSPDECRNYFRHCGYSAATRS